MLTDFGRTMQSCVESCADELQDIAYRWSDEQRHEVERVLCVHMLAMHGRGMRDVARMLRLHAHLEPAVRAALADEVENAVLQRREFV